MFYWFVFAQSRRKVRALQGQPLSEDKKLPIFHDVDPSWTFLRLIPLSGWKSAWSIESASGEKFGEVIVNFKIHVDLIVFRNVRFEVSRYVEGIVFRGYVFKSNLETGKLETDSEFSMLDKMKVNFTNLKGLNAFVGLRVQSDDL